MTQTPEENSRRSRKRRGQTKRRRSRERKRSRRRKDRKERKSKKETIQFRLQQMYYFFSHIVKSFNNILNEGAIQIYIKRFCHLSYMVILFILK